MKARGAADFVMDPIAFEALDVRYSQASRLKGADTRCDDDGARIEPSTGGGTHLEAAGRFLFEAHGLFAEVKDRPKRLDLLAKALDELPGAADRQGGEVVKWGFRGSAG